MASAPKSAPSSAPVVKKTQAYDDWEAKDAMNTLQRADEIQANPGLHRAAKRHARKQARALKKIASAKPMAASKR
jgi:hypothetical protein